MKISARILRKGPLINELRETFYSYNPNKAVNENIFYVIESGQISATSENWLNEVKTTLSSIISRIDSDSIVSLSHLAKSDVTHETWMACLHWHFINIEPMYRRFCTEWLYEEYSSGTFRMRSEDALSFVNSVAREIKGESLSEYGTKRTARDLFRICSEFGFVKGKNHKEFTSYTLTEESFLYLLHGLNDKSNSPLEVLSSKEWRAFQMSEEDVVRELLRLHQYKQLHYEAAGSVVELVLPYSSLPNYAKEMI